MLRLIWVKYKSSRTEVFCKKVFLKDFAKFTGKIHSLFFNKAAIGQGHLCIFVCVIVLSCNKINVTLMKKCFHGFLKTITKQNFASMLKKFFYLLFSRMIYFFTTEEKCLGYMKNNVYPDDSLFGSTFSKNQPGFMQRFSTQH